MARLVCCRNFQVCTYTNCTEPQTRSSVADFDDNYCTIFVYRYNTDDARIDGVTIIYYVEMKKKFAIRGSVKETNVLFYTRVHTYYYI